MRKMAQEDVFDVFGLAFKHQLESKDPIYHVIERDDGYIDVCPTDIYFEPRKSWPAQEREILNYVISPILDIGCGAGRHSLYLQDQGYDIVALDVSEGALFVAKQRGIKHTLLGSAQNLPPFERLFSTFLLFGNNFGICGSPAGTIQMLEDLQQRSTPEVKILLSYRDPTQTDNPYHLAYHQRNQAMGLPIGQCTIRLRYLRHKSAWFSLYLPTPEEFSKVVQRAQWNIITDLVDGPMHYVVLDKNV